jgi:hypothetical protein
MADTNSELEAILDQMRPIILAALAGARKAGADEARAAIIKAATGFEPIALAEREPPFVRAPNGEAPLRNAAGQRSPRGLLTRALESALTVKPGSTTSDIEQHAAMYDSRIARKSVGNELRRQNGTRYRRDAEGGWHLMEAPM